MHEMITHNARNACMQRMIRLSPEEAWAGPWRLEETPFRTLGLLELVLGVALTQLARVLTHDTRRASHPQRGRSQSAAPSRLETMLETGAVPVLK